MDDVPKRKRIRLEGYDYSQNGAYFVTICTHNRECLLGDIIVGKGPCTSPGNAAVGQGLCSCRLSATGKIVQQEIENIPARFDAVHVDKYVIMPNHIHIILLLNNPRQEQSPCPTVGDVICVLKSITTKTANRKENLLGRKIWQFRFHDRIIRNEREYLELWQYIAENPLKWEQDGLYQPFRAAIPGEI